MWRVVKAELQYNWPTLGMMLLVPLLYIFEGDDSGTYLLTMMAFLMVNSLLPVRYKENRGRQQALLPVGRRAIGVGRILLMIVFAALPFGLYFLIETADRGLSGGVPMELLLGYAAMVAGYSAWFIGSDLFPRAANSSKVGTGMVIILGLLMTLGLVMMILTQRSGGAPPLPVRILTSTIDFLVAMNPFGGPYGPVKLLAFALMLSGLSVLTYGRRKTYLH